MPVHTHTGVTQARVAATLGYVCTTFRTLIVFCANYIFWAAPKYGNTNIKTVWPYTEKPEQAQHQPGTNTVSKRQLSHVIAHGQSVIARRFV